MSRIAAGHSDDSEHCDGMVLLLAMGVEVTMTMVVMKPSLPRSKNKMIFILLMVLMETSISFC